MLVLLTYDIDLSDKGRRLHKVAKICESYGIRVQNSVFEIDAEYGEISEMKGKLQKIIKPEIDTIRIYKLGNAKDYQVDVMGISKSFEVTEDKAFFL